MICPTKTCRKREKPVEYPMITQWTKKIHGIWRLLEKAFCVDCNSYFSVTTRKVNKPLKLLKKA